MNVLPGLKALRYLIPFHESSATTNFLRAAADRHPGGFAAMGDDLEKFGVWPETYKLCYTDGWLDRFFSALERNSDWLLTSTPADAIASHPPLGRADLPTASYTEMMEWSLATPARERYHALLDQFSSRADVMPFLRGGIWRGFFTKYAESNLLHKKMLHVSQKIRKLARSRRFDRAFKRARQEATRRCCAASATIPIGTASSAGFIRRICAPRIGPRSSKRKPSRTLSRTTRSRSRTPPPRFRCRRPRRNLFHLRPLRRSIDAGRRRHPLARSIFARRTSRSSIRCAPPRRPITPSSETSPRSTPMARNRFTNRPAPRKRISNAGCNYDRWPRNSFRLLLFARDKTQEDYADGSAR